MKVLHYIKTFSHASETFIYDLLKSLENNDVDNYVLSLERRLEEERHFDKIKVFNKKPLTLLDKTKNVLKLRPRYWQSAIDEYIENVNPELIHIHFVWTVFDMFKFTRKHKKFPLLVSCHGADILDHPQTDKNYRKNLLKLAKRKDVFFTAPSEFLKNKIVEIGIDKNEVFVTHNMLSPSFLGHKKQKIWKQEDELVIANIGRLVEWKGHKYLIKAFAVFLENYPNAKLKIIGYGVLEEELKKLTEELGINEKVEFLGMVEHSKIPEILKNSDIYVQPSIVDKNNFGEETFGIALLEAIAVGLPVIFTNTGGMKEVVGEALEKTAFMVEQKSPEQIAQKLNHIINNPDIFDMAKDIYTDKISSNFSEQKIVDNYKEIYQMLKKIS